VKAPLRFLALGELSLAVIGLVWAELRSIDIPCRIDARAIGLGILLAVVLSVVNITLYHVGRRFRRPAAVYDFIENELFPIFRRCTISSLVILLVLVGLGEELLFRGVLQREIGLIGASALFGILHGPSRTLWPLAVWAAVMGACLGWAYEASGTLVVPALAHALYDSAAIAYARRVDASKQREDEYELDLREDGSAR
jgi:membrane protease YdiL (CAAX protease family)